MSEKPFKKLLGNRIYLKIPPRKESGIYLTPEMEKKLIDEEKEKLNKLEVYDVGDLVTNIQIVS